MPGPTLTTMTCDEPLHYTVRTRQDPPGAVFRCPNAICNYTDAGSAIAAAKQTLADSPGFTSVRVEVGLLRGRISAVIYSDHDDPTGYYVAGARIAPLTPGT